MEEKNLPPTEALRNIKQIMERSSKFISLSGLSGIAAGITAIIGAWLASQIITNSINKFYLEKYTSEIQFDKLVVQLLGVAMATLLVAFVSAFYFTWQKAKTQQLPVWDHTSRRLFWNIIIPMGAGGLFILAMLYYHEWRFVSSSCLIFYGLALVNASKFTLTEIRFLGYSEIILGLINMFFIEYSLYFWVAGFGFLHIVYGVAMWWKYDRK